MSHYFSKNVDEVKSLPKKFNIEILGEKFAFNTDNGVFSKNYLDYATSILLNEIVIKEESSSLLDVGCGYGPIGIVLNKVYKKKVSMIDINPRALDLAKKNALENNVEVDIYESDCLENVVEKFDIIVTNPPIRAGKDIIYKIFEQSFEKLNATGEFWIIIQYSHGAPSAVKKLQTIFDNVEIVYKKKGFYVIRSIK